MMDDRHEGAQPLARVLQRVLDDLHARLAARDLSHWPEELRRQVVGTERAPESVR